MTLILEDGTIVANANSYVTVAETTTYHTLYGNSDDWGTDTTLQTVAVIRATQAVDALFGSQYLGYLINTETQPLLYPRTAFYDNNGKYKPASTIHDELKRWVFEAALRFIIEEDTEIFMPDPNPADRIIQESFGAGSGAVSESITYSGTTSTTRLKKANIMISPIVSGSYGQRQASRG